jgi:hypothetical protein
LKNLHILKINKRKTKSKKEKEIHKKTDTGPEKQNQKPEKPEHTFENFLKSEKPGHTGILLD